jgi:hypothetical protein
VLPEPEKERAVGFLFAFRLKLKRFFFFSSFLIAVALSRTTDGIRATENYIKRF